MKIILKIQLEQFEMIEFCDVWINLCHLAANQLQIIWQLLKIDPTKRAKVLLNRDNVFTRFAREVLMVWDCEPAN